MGQRAGRRSSVHQRRTLRSACGGIAEVAAYLLSDASSPIPQARYLQSTQIRGAGMKFRDRGTFSRGDIFSLGAVGAMTFLGTSGAAFGAQGEQGAVHDSLSVRTFG